MLFIKKQVKLKYKFRTVSLNVMQQLFNRKSCTIV